MQFEVKLWARTRYSTLLVKRINVKQTSTRCNSCIWVDRCMVQYNCCQPVTRHWPNQPSVLLVSTYLGVCGPRWADIELVRVDVQLILFGGTRPQTRHAYVETHNRQWIISSITVQSHDFLVAYGYYIKLMKTLFHGWARKASDFVKRRRVKSQWNRL